MIRSVLGRDSDSTFVFLHFLRLGVEVWEEGSSIYRDSRVQS